MQHRCLLGLLCVVVSADSGKSGFLRCWGLGCNQTEAIVVGFADNTFSGFVAAAAIWHG
jgi:hypothetical protein